MYYRLYNLNAHTGRIVDGTDIRADSDEEAVSVGRQTYPDEGFEIWCRGRRVFTREPDKARRGAYGESSSAAFF